MNRMKRKRITSDVLYSTKLPEIPYKGSLEQARLKINKTKGDIKEIANNLLTFNNKCNEERN